MQHHHLTTPSLAPIYPPTYPPNFSPTPRVYILSYFCTSLLQYPPVASPRQYLGSLLLTIQSICLPSISSLFISSYYSIVFVSIFIKDFAFCDMAKMKTCRCLGLRESMTQLEQLYDKFKEVKCIWEVEIPTAVISEAREKLTSLRDINYRVQFNRKELGKCSVFSVGVHF